MTIDERIQQAIKQTIGAEIISLLEDDSVLEVMRNANGVLCVERLGSNIEHTGIILSDRASESFIRLLASMANEICNDKNPSLAVKLPHWRARFQGLLPPVVNAPTFSIRKHNKNILSLRSYIERKEMTARQHDCIIAAIKHRTNILISGGTGSGKTTLANAILQEMTETNDRIITVEDTPELKLDTKTGQQIFSKDLIGYTLRHALKDILRLRPDRIIVGELRDGTALDLIKAWNTGHSGGFTTVHANSCELAIHRIESLISEVSIKVPRNLIAETVNMVIQIKRDGKRRYVSDIKKLVGLDNKNYIFESIGGKNEQNKNQGNPVHKHNIIHM